MKKERVEFKLDSTDKGKAKEILDALGLSLSAFLTLCVKQLIIQEKIPFEVTAEKQVSKLKAAKVTENAEADQLTQPAESTGEKPKSKKKINKTAKALNQFDFK